MADPAPLPVRSTLIRASASSVAASASRSSCDRSEESPRAWPRRARMRSKADCVAASPSRSSLERSTPLAAASFPSSAEMLASASAAAISASRTAAERSVVSSSSSPGAWNPVWAPVASAEKTPVTASGAMASSGTASGMTPADASSSSPSSKPQLPQRSSARRSSDPSEIQDESSSSASKPAVIPRRRLTLSSRFSKRETRWRSQHILKQQQRAHEAAQMSFRYFSSMYQMEPIER
mmetsp:Transcript_24310/g.91791  ORF Transcript_24310/g.91791 Transcript_24310/m.91791 type:complete len:237 (-) Transcript_24310:2124-2834(-)